jgi:hypothetical protein
VPNFQTTTCHTKRIPFRPYFKNKEEIEEFPFRQTVRKLSNKEEIEVKTTEEIPCAFVGRTHN